MNKPQKIIQRSVDGQAIEGTLVSVAESTERFGEVCLEDGTILRAKLTVIDALRQDGKWDKDGNPLYLIRSQNVITIVDCPINLKKPESGDTIQ